MTIKITNEQVMFVNAMLIIRSNIDRNSEEYKQAKAFLDERFKNKTEDDKSTDNED